MKIYKERWTGDEICSDAFEVEMHNSALMRATGRIIEENDGEIDIGANPGEGEAEWKSDATYVNSIIKSFNLEKTEMTKQQFLGTVKKYLGKIKAYLTENQPDRVETFMKDSTEAIKFLVAKYNDCDVYVGESMDPESMPIICEYSDDGKSTYFYYLFDGLNEIKM
ncbi:putative Translationally-controlled tumor protein like protein [Blattamonas nauphoetae]|uniref:Translationally-controlled tumor protein like protein n=1 Tax=Blattamonas nauphoetae TaxID=2049346 RepID=A0ABQ9YGF3_9EUKA|nr:putative Translationally-controlled tumor protein like protein [Blattamonas nauphoetae]KAK2962805.1 putative Translationally-controlled tumor protein like protein [Blattamonas nauphoetae]